MKTYRKFSYTLHSANHKRFDALETSQLDLVIPESYSVYIVYKLSYYLRILVLDPRVCWRYTTRRRRRFAGHSYIIVSVKLDNVHLIERIVKIACQSLDLLDQAKRIQFLILNNMKQSFLYHSHTFLFKRGYAIHFSPLPYDANV